MTTPRTQEELDALARQHAPVSRQSTRRVYGGPVSRTGNLFSKDEVEYESDDGLESLSFIVTGVCDNGHLLGSEGIEIAGKCSVCGKWLCTREGCIRICVKGHAVCGRHSVEMPGGTYCFKHLYLLLGPALVLLGKGLIGFLKIAIIVLREAVKVLRAVMGSWWPFQ